jgi:hypothetical protein
MFRGREFEIYDEPEPGAAPALGRGTEQPEPEARLSESDEPAATREPNGDPSTAGRWARRATAMATLAAAAAAVAMLLPGGADHEGDSQVVDQGERAPLAQRPGRVQKPPLASGPSSRARPSATGRRPARRRPRPGEDLAGAAPPAAPSPPPVAQVPPVLDPPPLPPAVPAPPPPPPRPVAGPTRVLVGELPAPAAPKSPFEP